MPRWKNFKYEGRVNRPNADWNRLSADEAMWLLNQNETGPIYGKKGAIDMEAMLRRTQLHNKLQGVEPIHPSELNQNKEPVSDFVWQRDADRDLFEKTGLFPEEYMEIKEAEDERQRERIKASTDAMLQSLPALLGLE